ncbi:MAG: L-seryl-tRNA(Sec) selenium transferase [Chloroflexota bacterium]|nr:L-seryl-tRNA(Sec) selenium transferase [Dehalococcoidia bacterium]MDW8253140.1 L-seryl-tRNA(Sec) selenium transferase [Chloroflexota bacterium]
MSDQRAELRKLPSVDALLRSPDLAGARAALGDQLLADLARDALAAARDAIQRGAPAPSAERLLETILARAAPLIDGPLIPVINASGVILHTNLGRAPLAADAAAAALAVAQGYSNLEFDLAAGTRGVRDRHVEWLLCQVTGAEAALAVNNNAAAVLLALSALAAGREVIVSRGQAVEIGGGFRIPDVLRQSGATLVEVGTTNRTYLDDYAGAITAETAALLRVHRSNFALIGFIHEVDVRELAALAERHGLCLIDDLGSGCLIDTRRYGLAAEPTVQESVAAGAGIVCFSGDKLLGGPQAGLIVGRKVWVERLRRHPLARAVRIDKITLAALLATLRHYVRGDAEETIPVWQMIAAPLETLTERAQRLAAALGGSVVPGRSAVGGGSLPGQTLETRLVALPDPDPHALAARLRAGRPPVIGRIEDDRLLLDLRTVLSAQEPALIAAVRAARQS